MNDLKATKGTMAFLSPSETLAIAAKAKALKAAGENVCAMGAGEPDFDTPAHIKQAAIDALLKGETKYTPSSGIPALKKAIVEKFRNDNGIETEPSRVIVSPGAKFSGFATICTLCGPGDEVIVPAPYWVSYTEMIKAAGATAVIINCKAENNFELEPEALQSAITPRTKLLILNSPSNPTGAVYRVSTIEKIAEIALRNNIMVMSDEIYEKLVYDPELPHKSIASVSPEMNELTITINGFSKAYSMPGWRLGYLTAPKWLADRIVAFQSHTTSNPTSFAQYGALARVRNTPRSHLLADLRDSGSQNHPSLRRVLSLLRRVELRAELHGLRQPSAGRGEGCRGAGTSLRGRSQSPRLLRLFRGDDPRGRRENRPLLRKTGEITIDGNLSRRAQSVSGGNSTNQNGGNRRCPEWILHGSSSVF